MTEIEHERVDALPVRERILSDIPSAVGFLLTRLLCESGALLHAEYRRDEAEVTWFLRMCGERKAGEPSEGPDVAVANLPSSIFSSIVARLAVTFGIDYTTAGCAEGVIVFEGRRFHCSVFLSKCAATGYWIRMYAAPA